MNELRESLVKFNKLTLEIISDIKEGNIDSIDSLMDDRQKIIDFIESIDYSKEEFIDICNKLKIIENNKELEKIIKDKKEELRNELGELKVTRKANNGYNHRSSNALIFSKKI
ncbi:flagellar protein FliT [Clostridium sp. MSJ-11]|uniref:Flagellar protein FliT n=1 Tax=Clostridium mobile TaxID=2841512 RepID=A0ABS6EF94_9CLOT|nr:flagellar protein FliT [Clostridium mobile]MBU5483069.1 flagellar protein FliT [Clostridium mobile]